MSNKLKIYKTPANFCVQNAKFFLKDIEDVFGLNGSRTRNVFFEVMQTKKVDLLGLLLIYKFLNYTVKKKCFANPQTDLKNNKKISDELRRLGFKKLVDENFTIKDPDDTKTEFSELDGFFLAPIVLDRDPKSCKNNIVEAKIRNYYNDTRISQGLLQCIGEISSNFQEHAVADTKSVLVARGNKSQIEIACADNGFGIISTLMPALNHSYKKQNRYDVLKKSIEENITSKAKDGHMGCGLWLVNQFVTASNGTMTIFSEDGYLTNIRGMIKCGQSSFWQGTIIYVKMPLSNKEAFVHVLKEKERIIDSRTCGIELNII